MRHKQPSLAEVEVGLSSAKAQKRGTPHMKILSHVHNGVWTPHKIHMSGGWLGQEVVTAYLVGGWFFQEILPLRGSILQAGTC